MADGIQVDTGSGPVVATTERADSKHAQHFRVDGGSGTATNLISAGQKAKANSIPTVRATDEAPSTWATSHVTMSTSSTQRLAARGTRTGLLIQNLDSAITCWFGPSGVTSSGATGGVRCLAGATISLTGTFAVHGLSATGTPTVMFSETYD